MQALIYVDLATKKASETLGGSAFKFPELTYGEDLNLALRFAKRTDGTNYEVSRVVDELRASIGHIDARPEGGAFQIKLGSATSVVGTNVTTALAHNATAAQVESALNTLTVVGSTYGAATVEAKGGSWLVTFEDEGAAVPISVTSNSLFPTAFLRVRASEFNGQYVHDLRLIQAPVSFTDSSARVVADPPTISVISNGSSDGGEVDIPEIQKLVIPPDFRGLYQIRRGALKTVLLDADASADEIQTALQAIADEDGVFTVTNPEDNTAHITFGGDMAGIDQDLMTVSVFDAPEGDLTFTLNLDTPELHALLRKDSSVTLPLEIEADIQDVNDSEVVYTVKLLKTSVVVTRELNWEELSVAASADWLRPPLPTSYVPFSTDQVSNGQLHYATAIGNGVLQSFTIDHNLATTRVDVIIHANSSSGAPLVYGTDYTYARTNDNSLAITTTGTPTSNQYLVTVLGLEETSYFDAHTHLIANITGLQDILDAYGARLTALEGLSGNTSLAASDDATGEAARWILPTIFNVFPSRVTVPDNYAHIAEIPTESLGRARGLLAAVHDAAVEALPSVIPAPAGVHIGRVFQNQTGASMQLPGGQGHRSVTLKDDEYAACDGRLWYPVAPYGAGETSYYPTNFERELFRIHVNEKQLRLKKRFELRFALELATLLTNTNAMWSLVIEVGEAEQDTTPTPIGTNLSNIVWRETPLLEQRIVVTPVAAVHRIGLRVDRSSEDVLTITRLLYGAVEGGATPPDSANFALRGRLIRFDTENSQSDPKGFAAIKGLIIEGTNVNANEGLALIG